MSEGHDIVSCAYNIEAAGFTLLHPDDIMDSLEDLKSYLKMNGAQPWLLDYIQQWADGSMTLEEELRIQKAVTP